MSDYKWGIQVLADEISDAEFGKDFYELSQDQQFEVFGRATDEWMDRRAMAADLENDMEMERRLR